MKRVLFIVTLLIPNYLIAGSLGKYQIEPLNQPPNFSSQIKQQVIQKKLQKDKALLFYSNFENRVISLNKDEKADWLKRYKQKMKAATERDPVDPKEVKHYARLVDIIQRHID